MADKKMVSLLICGSRYVVSTDEDVETVRNIASEVETYIDNTTKSNNQISTTMAAVFAALEYCGKSRKAEESSNHLRKQIKEYVDEARRARLETEEVKKELNRLTQQNQVLRVKLTHLGESAE